MFDCYACRRRLIAALCSSVDLASSRPFMRPVPRIACNSNRPLILQRAQSTALVAREANANDDAPVFGVSSLSRGPSGSLIRYLHPRTESEVAASSRKLVRSEREHKPGPTDGVEKAAEGLTADGKLSTAELKRLERTLKFLVDPLRLSEYVQRKLKKDNIDEALKVTRLASTRHMKCTVAWNFIIDWQMRNGKVNAAVKTFNEMKKRAQPPDSYTHSHLLRGLLKYANRPNIVQKGMSIYNAMLSPSSKVSPNTVHANLLLKLCASVGDLDSMWAIAGRLEAAGNNSADHRTYSIILSAEFHHMIETAPESSDQEVLAQHFEKSVVQARRLWVDIVRRWRKGQLTMDEALMRHMGKILLLSYRPRDWDDVFSLVEQTQNIPRMAGLLGTARRARFDSGADSQQLDLEQIPESMRQDVNDRALSVRGDEFASQSALVSKQRDLENEPKGRNSYGSLFASPGRPTLSLLMEAALKFCSKKIADDYWRLLTDPKRYNIEPDHDNYKCYLRVLRQSHSSAQAIKLLRDGYEGKVMGHDLFRIGMATCIRDKLNPNSFDHATDLVDMMRERSELIDPIVLTAYMRLATAGSDPSRVERAIETMDKLAETGTRLSSFNSVCNGLMFGNLKLEEATAQSFWGLCNTILRSIDWLFVRGHVSQKAKWMRLRHRFKTWAGAFGRAMGKPLRPTLADGKGTKGPHFLNVKNINKVIKPVLEDVK